MKTIGKAFGRLGLAMMAWGVVACGEDGSSEPGPTGTVFGPSSSQSPTQQPTVGPSPNTNVPIAGNGTPPSIPQPTTPVESPTPTPAENPTPAVQPGNANGQVAAFLEDMGDGWTNLVQGSWSLPAASEGYICVRFTLPEAVAFKSMKPISPPGTHHTVLSFDDTAAAPDGSTECDAFANGDHILAASGVGTEATDPLPDGVSFQLPKGAQLLLNLHLFNATDAELTGVSGTLITLADAEANDIKAENILAGTVNLNIPPGRVTQSGRCTFTGDATIVQLFPHMHQVGAHMKVVAHSAAMGEQVIYDSDYNFEEQLFYTVGPVQMATGDYVSVDCTYENTTGQTINWGDSSKAEMCFVGLVRYPALGGNLGIACTN